MLDLVRQCGLIIFGLENEKVEALKIEKVVWD